LGLGPRHRHCNRGFPIWQVAIVWTVLALLLPITTIALAAGVRGLARAASRRAAPLKRHRGGIAPER